MLQTQRVREDMLQTRVAIAISSNRLVRLDNPILRQKIIALRRRSEQVQQTFSRLTLTSNAATPAAAAAAAPSPVT